MTNHHSPATSMNYRNAGVDIQGGNQLVERIKPLAQGTTRPGVLSGLGGFGALMEIPLDRFKQPVLVAGADGVGTKLKLAQQLDLHATVGIDLVAMCANDILVQGAEPLFFLDYYATGHLDIDCATEVIAGIAEGCKQAGAALIGGESAEMPGMYTGSDYDLAGFCVGIVEKNNILDGNRVNAGDVVLGLASSGPHSNGYSLIRKIIDTHSIDPGQNLDGHKLSDLLMAPTCIYVKALLPLLADNILHALAHITGGGITENLPRILSPGMKARVDASSWKKPKVFQWLESMGNIDEPEMLTTFNCGIGMIAILPQPSITAVIQHLANHNIESWIIGEVAAHTGAPYVEYI